MLNLIEPLIYSRLIRLKPAAGKIAPKSAMLTFVEFFRYEIADELE